MAEYIDSSALAAQITISVERMYNLIKAAHPRGLTRSGIRRLREKGGVNTLQILLRTNRVVKVGGYYHAIER